MTTPQPRYQDPRADEQVRSGTNGLAPPPQFGRPPRFAPPPQFGRPPPFVRRQAYHQTDPGLPRNGAHPELEAPVQQQRSGAPPSGQSEFDVPGAEQVPRPLADFEARAISFLIDCVTPVIVLNVLLSIGVATGSVALNLVLTIVGYLGLLAFGLWNSCYRQGSTGQSVGRRVARTKLVKIETGQPVGCGRALLRQFCHILDFPIGCLWPLWDGKRQTFADKIVGTVVIRVEGATEDRSGNSLP